VVSVPITAVDPTLSFLMFSSRHDSNRPVGSMILGRLNATGDAVEFERVTDEAVPVTMTMEWYVVTYSCGITVQRGEVSQATTTIDVPISSVGSTSQAFVTWSKTPAAIDNTIDTNDPVVGELTSPTNLQFRVNLANAAHIIAWQVIAFDNPVDVDVQSGTTSLLGTATSTTATLSPAVDVTKTFVLASYRIAGSGPDIGANMLRAELTNSTTITFTRDISGTPDDITEISWQAIELKEGSTVQRGTQALAAATAQQNIGINPVDTTKAYAFGSVQAGSGQNMGRSNYAGDDIIGVGSFTAELSTSQLTLTRDNTAAASNVGWFVVHWGSAPCVPLGSVQSGTATSSANGAVSVPITAVDPTLSFLMFSSRHDSNRPVGSMIRGRLNATGDAVEFERVTDEAVPVTMTMEWYVVTYTCGITVQRGEVSQATTTIDVPISSVGSTSQAFVTWSKTPTATDGTFNADDSLLDELTSPTNLQFRVNSANAAHIIAWQVIAFDNAADVNVQSGTTSLLGTATSTTATLTPAVDVTKTFVLASYRTAGTGADIGARMLRAELTNSTTITFTRDISGTPDDITEITWQAIELDEGSSVQRGTQAFAAATAQQNVGINPIDTNKAYAFGSVQAGSGQNMGRSNYAADDIIGTGSVTAELSTSQLSLTRDNTAASANVGWFVVHWGSAPPPDTYYVRTDGSDSNTGLSNDAAGAWLTIQKAADTMVAGDTVRVQPGTYQETVTPLNAGTAANSITYRADGVVVVDGGNVRCKAFDVVGTGYLVIDGFEITDQPDCGGVDSAVDIVNADNVTVRNNIIHDTGRDAVYFGGTSANGLVENNLIYNIDDDGSTPAGGGGHVFRNNTFAGTMVGWALESGDATNLFEDNIFWVSNGNGAIQNTALGTFNYNDYNGTVLPGTGNFQSDPLFVNEVANDYHLSHIAAGQGADSPAIDAGSDTAANLGLDTRTTRTDSGTDTGTADLGYHYLP
jgi:uncharacterized protein YxjI